MPIDEGRNGPRHLAEEDFQVLSNFVAYVRNSVLRINQPLLRGGSINDK
jgi:hypothetical protein